MATKPSELPEWATGAADIVDPLLAEKQAGWTEGYEPPSQWFNWWMNLVYTWCVWLDAFETTAHTWTEVQTFDQGFNTNFPASSCLFNDAQFAGEVDMVEIHVSGAGSRASDFGYLVGFGGLATFSGGVLIQTLPLNVTAAATIGGTLTANGTFIANGPAVFEGNVQIDGGNFDGGNGTWTLQQVAFSASRSTPIVSVTNGAGSGVGAAAGYFKTNDDTQPALVADASSLTKVALQAKGNIELKATIPAGGVAVKDYVTKLSIAKVLVKLKLNTTSTPDVDKELNMTSVAHASGGDITINFAQDFADADYVVCLHGDNQSNWAYNCVTRAPGSCVINIYAIGGGQIDRATAGSATIDFLVFGEQ